MAEAVETMNASITTISRDLARVILDALIAAGS